MSDILHTPQIDETWYRRGLCRDETLVTDPDMFYPVGSPGNPAYDAQVAEALKVCEPCPVRKECLLWAVESAQEHGVWGNTEEQERMAMIRKARQAGALAMTRYPTNGQVSDIVSKLIAGENARLKSYADRDAARQRHLQKQR